MARIGIVLEALGHLASVLSEDHARDDAVLEWLAIKESCSKYNEGVEPPAGLVEALVDEVGREVGLEPFAVLEGVVGLRVWHRARLEPAIEHFGHSRGRLFAVWAWECHRVDEVLVQIVDPDSGQCFEFVDRADAGCVAVRALPHRDAGTPVAVAADRPVSGSLEPVAEPLLADVAGHPMDVLVQFDHPVLELLDSYEPRRNCLVDERRLGTPAEWIGVSDLRPLDQQAFDFQ